jgi:hypothetical protein
MVGLFHPRPRWPAARVAIFVGMLTNLAIMIVVLIAMIVVDQTTILVADQAAGTISSVNKETYGLLILLIVGGAGASYSGVNRLKAQDRLPSRQVDRAAPRRDTGSA